MAAPRLCKIPDCGKKHYGHGLCRPHWKRHRRHGDPLGGGTSRGEPERFFREVVLPYDGDECLTWPYGKSPAGYGILRQDGRDQIVSRLVCEEVNGPPPDPKYDAAHSCGNGHLACVTGAHLSWKTRKENVDDQVRHGTRLYGENCNSVKLRCS